MGRTAWTLPKALTWSYTTARGPGGQHVNKASTAAMLRISVARIRGLDEAAMARLLARAGSALVGENELLFRCDLHRSQLQNKDACMARLVALVQAASVKPKVRKKTKPTRGSVERRLDSKKRDSGLKRERNWKQE